MTTNVGQAIRKLRKIKGWTLLELANAADSDPGNISRIERGLQPITEDMLGKLSNALGIPISKIYAIIEPDGANLQDVARTHDKELAKLEALYLSLNGRKRRQVLRLIQALQEE
jgi:transcriptional regulator with XRE-family HTH domain